MPLRAKVEDMEAILTRDVAQGRLALGALLDGDRLRVHRDGRIEGSAILAPTCPRTSLPPRGANPRSGQFGW